MANCTKCNAELGPAAKFCTICGMPAIQSAPFSQVNPFAATASPTSKNALPSIDTAVVISTLDASPAKEGTASSRDETPPEGIESSPVSPLAVSSALSERGAFQQAVASIKEIQSVLPPPPAAPAPVAKKPGTRVMANAPSRPLPASPASPLELSAQPQAPTNKNMRTVAMTGAPKIVVPSSAATGQPPGANSVPPQAAAQAQALAAQPLQANAAGAWGRNGAHESIPQQPAGPHGYPATSYQPGSRVLVTWSNGQRYPATVKHVSGSQCHVVFPDGQQHWVEAVYLSPG